MQVRRQEDPFLVIIRRVLPRLQRDGHDVPVGVDEAEHVLGFQYLRQLLHDQVRRAVRLGTQQNSRVGVRPQRLPDGLDHRPRLPRAEGTGQQKRRRTPPVATEAPLLRLLRRRRSQHRRQVLRASRGRGLFFLGRRRLLRQVVVVGLGGSSRKRLLPRRRVLVFVLEEALRCRAEGDDLPDRLALGVAVGDLRVVPVEGDVGVGDRRREELLGPEEVEAHVVDGQVHAAVLDAGKGEPHVEPRARLRFFFLFF
mmetsp:Transcript_9291/g.30187  ORF Transcript_9291/g.30187 Transcript_9291/m.30187 type:complete len:254 (+) Transcript_9291:1711-2472(+)